MPGTPIEILLVEDNPGDVELTRQALEEMPSRKRIHVAADGAQALAFLRREAPFENAPRPHLVLLDLNLPRLSGRQVLAVAKTQPSLRSIPVVVLSSSPADRDVIDSYDLHANCYISKPADLDEYMKAFRALEQFWFDTARLPGC